MITYKSLKQSMITLKNRTLCLVGIHEWKVRLTNKGRAFFARLGVDTSANISCSRPYCKKMKYVGYQPTQRKR